MAQGFAELGAAVQVGSSLAELHAIGHAYFRFALANAPVYQLMFGTEVSQRVRYPELASAERQVHDRMREAIEAAQRHGVLATHDVADVTVLMACVMHGLCSLLLAGQLPEQDPDKVARTVMRLVDQGLANRWLDRPGSQEPRVPQRVAV